MKSRRHVLTVLLRWLAYTGVLVLATTLQAMPRFLQLGDVKPVFLLSACIAVALYEGEFAGALFGVVGGLLWDASAGRVGGFFAVMFLVACFLAACIWQLYLRDNWLNFFWISLLALFVMLGIDFIVSYLLRGYPAPGSQFARVVLPMCVLSAICGLPLRLLVRMASRINLLEKK